MPRKRDGFVPLGDVAEAVELQDGRALTRLDQVTQLIDASEADADLGFMARLLAPIGNVPPTECEQQYYLAQKAPVMTTGVN